MFKRCNNINSYKIKKNNSVPKNKCECKALVWGVFFLFQFNAMHKVHLEILKVFGKIYLEGI